MFFSAPGGFGSVGASREDSWSPLGAQDGAGGLQEPFWQFLEPKRSPGASFLELFGTSWASILVTFALGSLRPRVYVGACRLPWCSPSLSFRPLLSARWPVSGAQPLEICTSRCALVFLITGKRRVDPRESSKAKQAMQSKQAKQAMQSKQAM